MRWIRDRRVDRQDEFLMSSDNRLQQEEVVGQRPPAERPEGDSPVPANTAAIDPGPGGSEPYEPHSIAVSENGVDSPGDARVVGTLRRVRLNPTVNPAQAKAIPSLPPPGDPPPRPPAADSADSSTASPNPDAGEPAAQAAAQPPAEPASAPEPAAAAPPAAASPLPRAGAAPIPIPPAVTHLDAQLEAEIDRAMAQAELEAAAVQSAQQEQSGEETADGEHPHPARPPEEALEPGVHLTGRIQSIHGDSVFLDLGYRSPGAVPLRQFVSGKKPEVGQLIEVLVDRIVADEGLIHLNLPKGLRRIAGNWEALAKGQIVDCIVNRTNKGGLEVTVGGLRGFLPSSQVDFGFVADLTPYVGQKLRVEVVEANPRKRNLVVSRRAYLQIERQEAEEKLWQTLEVGQTFNGRVKTIKDYGAFVDLGGADGFLHIGEMAWHRIKHPSEVVEEGQHVDVKILSLDRDKKKVSLGMKQLAQNPWANAAERFPANSAVTGKVTRIADFGAFVELEPGLEGLVHVSELDHKRVRHPSDVLKVHQVVTAQVLEVDAERKRVSLSLKALQPRPEEPKPAEESAAEPVARRRNRPLKGGTGSTAAGGLFGNPADFR
jgi:small subunit ribosomal protein S1